MSNSDTGAKDSFGHRIELSISCGIVDIVTFLYRQKQRVEVDFAEIGRTLDVEASNSNCCCEVSATPWRDSQTVELSAILSPFLSN